MDGSHGNVVKISVVLYVVALKNHFTFNMGNKSWFEEGYNQN